MNFIADETKARWITRARRGALSKLRNLIEFRALMDDAKAEGVLMQVYAEAAEAMLCATDTLRRDIGIIREYPTTDLIHWIANGISFDHMETANALHEYAHKAPADLLNEAINPGNAEGATMTVRELTAYTLGEKKRTPLIFQVANLFERIGGIPHRWKLNWDEEKTMRFNDWIETGKEFFK